MRVLGLTTLGLFFYVFPDGRFVPRWPALGLAAVFPLGTLFPGSGADLSTWPGFLTLAFILAWTGTTVFAQVWRYWRTSDATIFTAMRAGARGYVLKDAEKGDVLRAIRAIGRGEAIFSPAIASRLIDFFSTARPAVPAEAFPTLTAREREILHLIVQGASNAEIARLLSLSGKTVANYVSHILGKLQAADREDAIRRAQEAGLG